ncbi:MAG: hypothetical protein WCG44_03845, partial [bacterium]
NDINFLRNNTLDAKHPSWQSSVDIFKKMTENVGTYYDEAQLTLDPNVAGINQKGDKTVATASKELAAKEVAEILTKEAILVKGNYDAHKNWQGGKSALADRFLSPDGVVLDTARFSAEAEAKITASLREKNPHGGEFFDTISKNRFTTTEELMALTGKKDAAAIEHVLDQLSMLDTYAKSLDAGFERAIDKQLSIEGEARYQKPVSIPKNGSSNEGQTFSGDMYLTMEYVGAIRNGQVADTVGLSTTSNKFIKSTIIDYLVKVSEDARNGQSAVTGTLGGMRGAAETVLEMRIHASSDATTKIVNTAESLDGALVNQKNTHAVKNSSDLFKLIKDMVASGKVKGSTKYVHGIENLQGIEIAKADALGRELAGQPKQKYIIQEGGKEYFEVTFDAQGKVTSKMQITPDRIQQRYQNGEENLVLIMDKGGATGDSIKTPENVPFVPIFVEGQPTYAIAQEGSRGNRGNAVDMATFAIVVDSSKPLMKTSGTAESRVASANENFDFATWRSNMERYETNINQNNATSILNNRVEAQGRLPLEDLIKSTNAKVRDWASKTLLDVFSTSKDGRSLSTQDVAKLSIDRRSEIARDASLKMQEVFRDPGNKSMLEQISREHPDIYARMEANRDFIKNNPNGFEYAPFGPKQAVDGRDSFILSKDLQSGADAHKQTVSVESESKYIASTEAPKTEIVAKEGGTPGKVAVEPVNWSTLEIAPGYSPTTGKFSVFTWIGNKLGVTSATTKAISALKADIAAGKLTPEQAMDRVNALDLNSAQRYQITRGDLFMSIPGSVDLDGNISAGKQTQPSTTVAKVPTTLSSALARPDFTRISFEDNDGIIYSIEKNTEGKLIYSEVNTLDSVVTTSHEYTDADLTQIPQTEQLSAIRFNNETVDKSTYSPQISADSTNLEALSAMVNSPDFHDLTVTLDNGDTLVFEIIGDIVINTKTAEGRSYQEAPSNFELERKLGEISNHLVSLTHNRQAVPLTSYLVLTPEIVVPEAPAPSLANRIVSSILNWFKSPQSEKAGGLTITDTSNTSRIVPALSLSSFPAWLVNLGPAKSLTKIIASPSFTTLSLILNTGEVATFTNLQGVIYLSKALPGVAVNPAKQSVSMTLNEVNEYLIENRLNIASVKQNDEVLQSNTYFIPQRSLLERLNSFLIDLSSSYLASTIANTTDLPSWFSNTILTDPIKLPPKIEVNTAKLKANEAQYIQTKLPKAPGLDTRYAHESTGDVGYRQDMDRYIGKPTVEPAPEGNISKEGLDQVRTNLAPELTRLFNSIDKRLNPDKLKIVTWQLNRYIELLQQAIDEGDIKTSGDNILSLADIQSLVLRNIHTLAFQDFVATTNTLGDHGVRHLVEHNIKTAEKVLDLARTNFADKYSIRAIDYLIAHQTMIDHDTGYAVNIVRVGVESNVNGRYDAGHNLFGAKIIRERTSSGQDPFSRLYGAEGVARIHQGVLNHDGSTVDISRDAATTVDSAIHIADNTHAFESKLPELLYNYPESIVSMRLLKVAGEMGNKDLIDEIRHNLIKSIEANPNIGTDDKEALKRAVNTLTPNSYAFSVGRIMGNDPKLSFDANIGKIVVSVTENDIHQDVVKLFDQSSYDQLAKFIADILGIQKQEAINRINNNERKFEGTEIIIQALTGDNKNTSKSTFEQKLAELTSQNIEFNQYLARDKQLKIRIDSLNKDINIARNAPKSLHVALSTRTAKNVIIKLKSGNTIAFADVGGSLSYTLYTSDDTYLPTSRFITNAELDTLLPALTDIETVTQDGVELVQNSYTTEKPTTTPSDIADLEEQLLNFAEARSKLINDYLDKSAEPIPTTVENPIAPVDTVSPNTKFEQLVASKVITWTDTTSTINPDLLIATEKTLTDLLETGSIVTIDYPNGDVYMYYKQGGRYLTELNGRVLGEGHVSVKNIVESRFPSGEELLTDDYRITITDSNNKQLESIDLGELIIKSPSTPLITVTAPNPFRRLLDNIATFFSSIKLNRSTSSPVINNVGEPITLSRTEQLIGNPAINITLTNDGSLTGNQSLNLDKTYLSNDKSLIQYLDEGNTVVLVRPDGTRTFFSKDGNEYTATTGDKTNKHTSITKLSLQHFPNAEELINSDDANPYLISVITPSYDKLLVEPSNLFNLVAENNLNFTETRSLGEQVASGLLGIGNIGIVLNSQGIDFGHTLAQLIVDTFLSPPLLTLLPDYKILTYNAMVWTDNLNLMMYRLFQPFSRLVFSLQPISLPSFIDGNNTMDFVEHRS